MCVESHARDVIENGFDVVTAADANATAGDAVYEAAMTNFDFSAQEVITINQVIKQQVNNRNNACWGGFSHTNSLIFAQ